MANEVGFFRGALGELVSSVGDAWKRAPKHNEGHPGIKSRYRELSDYQEQIRVTESVSFWGYNRSTVTEVFRRQKTASEHSSYRELAERESLATRFGFAVIEGALSFAHLFSRNKDSSKKESHSFFPPIPHQPAGPDVKPKTNKELEESVAVLFPSGTDPKSEGPKLPLPGSQAIRNVDGLGLNKAGRPNVHTNDRGLSLPSSHRANVRKDAGEAGLRSQPLGFHADGNDLTLER
jgi:hypothetical protein